MGYCTHLETVPGGTILAADRPENAPAGTFLYARYDLDRIRREVTVEDIAAGPASLWRYAALLPIEAPAHAVSLGEGFTPLLKADRLARSVGCATLRVKDEGQNPSGTFKDRGASVALSRYREMGVKAVASSSSGNAGGSWGLYGARAGIECINILPSDAQTSSRRQCSLSGARTYYVEDWTVAGPLVADACRRFGWFNVNTLKEPYRMEGKKTMGLEIAEQLGWKLPDVIVYPMGGGLGPLAIWKAFEELLALGWVTGPLPRLLVTQWAGCGPLVKAWNENKNDVEPWTDLDVPPGGLKSVHPPGGRGVLELLARHGGGALAITLDEALREVREMAACEGILACPESATAVAGLRKALASGMVDRQDSIVVICTGSGLKSIPLLPAGREQVIHSLADLEATAAADAVALPA
ncbi:MAG: threonine synthase [Burkholderiales bacterium]